MQKRTHYRGVLCLGVLALFAAPAFAQKDAQKDKTPTIQLPSLPVERPALIARPTPPELTADPVSTASVTGCLISQTYNTQSIEDYSMQFRLGTAAGPVMFNFAETHLEKSDPSSFLLTDREHTLMWERIMETIERAAMSERQIRISYEVPSNNVFGVAILWDTPCLP